MFWKKYLGHIVFLLLLVHVLFYSFPVMLHQSLPTAVAQGTHYTPITITNNANQDLTDYQVKIVLDSSWDGWSNVAQDGSDIYFLDSSNNPLYYWIESFDYSNQEAVIWVKVSNIPASSSITIYMYYGGDNPYLNYNDPNEVFLLYDDFESDLSDWSLTIGSGSIELSSEHAYAGLYSVKIVDTGSSSSDKNYMFRSVSFSEPIICEVMFYDITGQSGSEAQVLRFDDGSDKVLVGVAESSVSNNYGYRFGSTWHDSGIPRSNGWHRFSIAWDGSVYKVYIDGQYMASSPTGYGSPTRLELGSEWGTEKSTFYYDTLIIRKYVDPEPSVSIGSSEPISGSQQQYRTPIVISNNADQDVTDYSVKIILNATNWDGWDHVSSDGSDIYFLDPSNNPLYYYIEYFNKTEQQAIIWVKVNLTANSNTTIYMYYGGDNPYSDYNDPENVFLWYDDFEDGDLSEYNQYGNDGTPVVEVTSNAVEGSYSLHLAQNTNNEDHVGVAYKYETFTNVRVHVKAVIDSRVDAGIFGILARFQGNDDSSTGLIDQSYYFGLFARDQKVIIWRNDASSTTLASASYTIESGKVYELEAILYNDYLALYVDGSKVLEANDNTYTSGYFGLVVIEADARFDTFYISKYVDPEPTISIGSSEVVGYGVVIEGVSPESVVGGTGDSVSFTVTLNNTLSQDVNVTVKLIDHRDVVRDEVNATVPANNTYNVSLTTVFTENDIGDHTWTISVYNASDNSLLDSCSVSVSVSVFNRTIEITAVNPESISGAPNDTITVNATIKSTLTTSETVNVSLVDHNSVVRDYSEVSIDPDQSINISLTTTLTRDDHGDHVWKLVVRSGDTVYDVVNITVSVYINMSLEYSYTLSFNPEINASSISGIRYSYTINTYSSMNSGSVSGIRYSYNINLSACRIANLIEGSRQGYLFGISSCVAIYTNSTGNWTLEAEICNSTVYTIAFNFLYVFENGGEGYPDARINIYVNDTGTPELYTSIYIPQGNTTVMLPADHIYSITIPSSGSTTYGSSFELISYTVNGEEGVSSIVLDKDYVINIKYRIYKEATTTTTTTTTPPSSTPTSTQTPVITITVTPPPTMTISGNVSGWFSPSFSVGAPNLVSPQGLLMLALFIGLFIVYSRVFPWGQALAVSSAVCMIISIALFGLGMFSFFLVFFVVGLGAWKILGK